MTMAFEFLIIVLSISFLSEIKVEAHSDHSSFSESLIRAEEYDPRSGKSSHERRRRRDDEDDWQFNYQNTDEWGKHYSLCATGFEQSPIDIDGAKLKTPAVSMHLEWHSYDRTPKSMKIKNDGHSVVLTADWGSDDDVPYISGGELNGDYAFHQLQFHWGPSNNAGSEHTVSGLSLPLEMHMIHYNKKYGSLSKAMGSRDGFVIIGLLFKIDGNPNEGIDVLQKNFDDVKTPGNEVQIDPFPLLKFDIDFKTYFAYYNGSLTIPPCTESVQWILPGRQRSITQAQIDAFRTIQLANGDDHNNRPTQPLNDRTLNYMVDDGE